MSTAPIGMPAAGAPADRRTRSRVAAACNALLRLSETLTFRCSLRNISVDAVQVVCDARYALLIPPRAGKDAPDDKRQLDISIAFPTDGTVRGFTARCRPKYCESLQDESMILGLQFVDLDRGSVQLLLNFIASLRGTESHA